MNARGIAAAVAAVALSAAHSTLAATASVDGGVGISGALGTDGIVRTWGDDSSGALGIARPLFDTTPGVVAGASDIVAISAGDQFALALRRDGTLIAWGNNASGQLGDGTTTSRSVPVAVIVLNRIAAISARGSHSVALDADGFVYEWGGGESVPTRVDGIDNVVRISAGGRHTLALRRDGSVWAWGEDDAGQLGDGTLRPYPGRTTPGPVPGVTNVVSISAGEQYSLALSSDGSVLAWGHAPVGDGTSNDALSPVGVQGLSGITGISAGADHSVAIRNDGTVFAWGANGYGELGDGTYEFRLIPVQLTGLAGAIKISTGFRHSFALISGGTLAAWGTNDKGELGDPSIEGGTLTPVPIKGLSGVTDVSVGDEFTVALLSDGTVRAWGDDSYGQLGGAASVFRTTPSTVALTNVQQLSVGGFHMLALRSDGSVFAWGDSRTGQIGDGTGVNRSSPVAVTGLGSGSGVVQVSAGGLLSLALKSDGSVLSWGDDYEHEIGNRAGTDSSVPSRVLGLPSIRSISAGGVHAAVLANDGTVWTWGADDRGQLGDGTQTELYGGRDAAAPVPGLSGVQLVSAGGDYTLALKSDGTLWAWGANESGQLGDGSNIDRLRPVQVASSLANIVAISAGESHSLVLLRDGTVWAWGVNYDGRLGDGTTDDHSLPVQVPGLDHVVSISASQHSMALKDDGSVWTWGSNGFGELGDGTLVPRPSAVVALHEGGTGSLSGNDWFLDLDPSIATSIDAGKVPSFLVVATGNGSNIDASLRFRPQDIGTSASIFVFALAPASIVHGAADAKERLVATNAKGASKDTPIPCVLAQLDSSGQLQSVSASSLQSQLSDVLSAQGQSVNVLSGAAAAQSGGATFFVGYGTSSNAMLANGTNRSVVSLPGSVQCQPQAPQTGWWWNPAEDGRGYSIEVRGNHYFFAAFLYDASGRASWYVSTGSGVSLDGSIIQGDLLDARGGQTLGGPYPGTPTINTDGTITLAFSDASHGTLVWPGGTVPIQRFNIIPNGLDLPPLPSQPESGWWWNPDESGRGFFMEWQGGVLDIAGYMYDDAGNPIWYLTENLAPSTNLQQFSSNWWQFADGMTLAGPWKPNRQVTDHLAPVTIQFQGAENAIMTLPNGRTTTLTRHRF